MFNPTEIVIDAFVRELERAYRRLYGSLDPDYPEIIGFIGRLALENIANSDAPYHDVEHTIMVTLAGQDILRGKHIAEGGVRPRDWLHFGTISLTHIDTATIEANIEHTRFPVPEQGDHAATGDYPGLVRAADLIGQLADIDYLRKMPALFAEFSETGTAQKLGYKSPAELRKGYPRFFRTAVAPYIGDALRYLRLTQRGKQWVASLYAHVFSEEFSAEHL